MPVRVYTITIGTKPASASNFTALVFSRFILLLLELDQMGKQLTNQAKNVQKYFHSW